MKREIKNPFFARLGKTFYESKPLLFIGIGILVLAGTSWGISTLVIALGTVAYAGTILFWRLESRGSLKEVISETKSPTPTSDLDNDHSDQSN